MQVCAQPKRGMPHLQLAHELVLVQVRGCADGLRHCVLDLLHLVRLLVDFVEHLRRERAASVAAASTQQHSHT